MREMEREVRRLEEALEPTGLSPRDEQRQRAIENQAFVESNGELIERKRQALCPAYAQLAKGV